MFFPQTVTMSECWMMLTVIPNKNTNVQNKTAVGGREDFGGGGSSKWRTLWAAFTAYYNYCWLFLSNRDNRDDSLSPPSLMSLTPWV